jgi:hypothetical protein
MPKRPKAPNQAARTQALTLAQHVVALEQRLAVLEARVRNLSAQAIRGATQAVARQRHEARRVRGWPRCPGCLLELPPGRRVESCVWCGFRFDAVPVLAAR